MIVSCITTLNEQTNIGRLVSDLRRRVDHVIVADAGSVDHTRTIANRYGAIVLNCGKGTSISKALLSAWDESLRMGADSILQIDAGGSHQASQLNRLLSHYNYDVVIGSRFIDGSQYLGGKFYRRYGSELVSSVCSLLAGTDIDDWTSGYRLFKRHVIQSVLSHNYVCRMHGWQIEVLSLCITRGFSVVEVPITYTAGRSSFKLSTVPEVLRAILLTS